MRRSIAIVAILISSPAGAFWFNTGMFFRNPLGTGLPAGLSFTDFDGDPSEVSGPITITKASDESGIISYNLYWGSNATTKLIGTPIATLSPTGTNLTHTLGDDTPLPPGATHILAFSENSDGEMTTGASVALVDRTDRITFKDLGDGNWSAVTQPTSATAQDAYVNSYGGGNSINGLYTDLFSCKDAIPQNCLIYIGFDISHIPAGATITDAKLQLYMTTTYDVGTISLQLRSLTGPFDQATITWNNRPGSDATDLGTTFLPSTSGWKEWGSGNANLRAYVESRYLGDKKVWFMLQPTTAVDYQKVFRASESNPPSTMAEI